MNARDHEYRIEERGFFPEAFNAGEHPHPHGPGTDLLEPPAPEERYDDGKDRSLQHTFKLNARDH